MSDFFASAHMAGGKLWGQPALLHPTDGIRRDLVLFRHTGKPFPGAFQCARTQNLGQLIGRLIEIGKAKVLAYTLEPVSYTHLRAHETDSYLVCRLLLEKKKKKKKTRTYLKNSYK